MREGTSSLTIRAIVLGLLGAAFIGATGYFNDIVMNQTPIYTSYMPLFIYGSLIIFVVALNPLLKKISRRAAFGGGELALAIAIMLPSCYVSSRALIHQFSGDRMAPRYMLATQPGWKDHDLLDRVPQVLLAGVVPEYCDTDILDAKTICEALASADTSPDVAALKRAIPDDVESSLNNALSTGSDGCRKSVVADALNGVLPRRDLFKPEDFPNTALPQDANRIFSTEQVQDVTIRRANRKLIDLAFGDAVHSWDAKEERAVKGFQMGLSSGTEHVSWGKIPWYAWKRTLWYWIPLIAAFCAVFMGLGLVAHRRMSEHELYPYPIVTFAKALLPDSKGTIGSVLRNRFFWVAAGIIFLIHLNNYAFEYWSEYLVLFPRRQDLRSLGSLVPVIERGGTHGVLYFKLFFTAIALSYFMADDVSFSMGIAPLVYSTVAGVLLGYGVNLHGGWYNSLSTDTFIAAGAYFGMFLIIAFTGRYHYAAVFKRSVFLKSTEDVRKHEVLGGRIFIVASLVFIIMCAAVGISVLWATLFLVMLIMIFAPLGRIIAETGCYIMHPHVYPTVLLWGFLGARALGPDQMLMLFMLGGVFALGMHMNVLPMFDHGLKLTENRRRATASFAGLGVLVALLVAIPVAIYLQYDHGFMAASDGWTRNTVPRFPLDPIVNIENRLASQGVLGESPSILNITPYWPGVLAFVITLGLIIATEAVRLRVTWWPIHPLLFVCAGWWHSRVLAISFLIGWAIKKAVTKYGGTGIYNKLRPVMFGVIAGDMLAGTVITIIGTIYYFATGGSAPRPTDIVPR